MKKMLLAILFATVIVIGCENTMNTPTSRVEEFLRRYQNMDEEVLTELDTVLENEKNMNKEERGEYQALLEKQYQNLSYKIKEEEIIGDTATVEVEIEVFDYATSITKAKDYFTSHPEEFEEKKKEDDSEEESEKNIIDKVEETIENTSAYIDYKISEMKKTSSKTKYDITFHLNKEEGVWTLENLSEEDLQKIHGLY